MNWLRGKTGDEIMAEFLKRNHISDETWQDLNKQVKKANKEESMRDWLWRLPMIIFGIALIVTLIVSSIKGFSPRIFPKAEAVTFYKMFANVLFSVVLYVIALICIITPIDAAVGGDGK